MTTVTNPYCDGTCKIAVCDCDEYDDRAPVDLEDEYVARLKRIKAIAMRVCDEHGIGQPTKPKPTTADNPIRGEHKDPNTRITLTVPPVFFHDHVARDLVTTSGHRDEYVIKETAKKITVSLSVEDALDLLSDATHYADTSNGWEWEMQYLVSSARATVRAIERQWPARG